MHAGQAGWIYAEPSPFNPTTGPNSPNLVPGPSNYPISAPPLLVDLTSDALPLPRLKRQHGAVLVPAYTDLKLHTMADGPQDPNAEPLDQNQPAGSAGFFAGNQKFVTRKLWGLYNSGPFHAQREVHDNAGSNHTRSSRRGHEFAHSVPISHIVPAG